MEATQLEGKRKRRACWTRLCLRKCTEWAVRKDRVEIAEPKSDKFHFAWLIDSAKKQKDGVTISVCFEGNLVQNIQNAKARSQKLRLGPSQFPTMCTWRLRLT